MQTLPDRYVFAIGEKLKHTRPRQLQEPIELVAYQDKRLCVVEAIKQYISVTDPLLDNSESKLLISFHKPLGLSVKTLLQHGSNRPLLTLAYTQHASCFDLIFH